MKRATPRAEARTRKSPAIREIRPPPSRFLGHNGLHIEISGSDHGHDRKEERRALPQILDPPVRHHSRQEDSLPRTDATDKMTVYRNTWVDERHLSATSRRAGKTLKRASMPTRSQQPMDVR